MDAAVMAIDWGRARVLSARGAAAIARSSGVAARSSLRGQSHHCECALEASRRDNFRVVVANLSVGNSGARWGEVPSSLLANGCRPIKVDSACHLSVWPAHDASAARANVVEFRNFYK